MLDRKSVVFAFNNHLQPLDYFLAFWEAGSSAFGRNDQWSDLDLYLVVSDEFVRSAQKQVEEIVNTLGGFDLAFQLPEPTWHGHFQIFYRLKNASPFLFLDIVIMKESSPDKFLEYSIHGKPIVYFDKKGIVKDHPIDPDEFIKRLQKRVEYLKTTVDLFNVLTLKEINREKDILAFPYYFSMILRPLVEILRIKYAPYHYNFFTAYLDYDLPEEIYKKLRRFFFILNRNDLKQAHLDALNWFWGIIKQLDFEEIRKKL